MENQESTNISKHLQCQPPPLKLLMLLVTPSRNIAPRVDLSRPHYRLPVACHPSIIPQPPFVDLKFHTYNALFNVQSPSRGPHPSISLYSPPATVSIEHAVTRLHTPLHNQDKSPTSLPETPSTGISHDAWAPSLAPSARPFQQGQGQAKRLSRHCGFNLVEIIETLVFEEILQISIGE